VTEALPANDEEHFFFGKMLEPQLIEIHNVGIDRSHDPIRLFRQRQWRRGRC